MKSLRYLPLLFLSLLLSACNFTLAADITPPANYQPPAPVQTQPAAISGPLYPLAPPDPAAGESIYTEKCAPCHGPSGMGDGPRSAQLPNPVPPIGSPDLARQSTPAEWYRIVTQGNLDRFMPPFPSLSDRERWDVVAYTYSLSTPPDALAEGAELYTANCATCHGPEGQGDGPTAASLSKKPTNLKDQELMAARSAGQLYQTITQGLPPEMPAFADRLSDGERWALAGYLRSLTFARRAEQTAAGLPTAALQGTPAPAVPALPTGQPATPMLETADPSAGVVRGSVVNASGGEVPAGLDVLLHSIDQAETVITATTTLQPDGTFLFEGVDLSDGRFFLATVRFEGATYGSSFEAAQPGVTELELPIEVYETTTDASQLVADRLHLFFEFTSPESLRVIQLYIVSNPTNKTVIAPEEGEPTLTFKLPPGAGEPEFDSGSLGERFVRTADGFGETQAIRPGSGSYQLLYAFDMPYNRKVDLVQPITLPANAVVVLVPEGSVEVRGEGLEDGGVRDVQGMAYHMYNAGSLAAGDELRLTVTGSAAGDAPAALSLGSSRELIVGVAAFGVVLLVAGAWLFRRSRLASEDDEAAETEDELEDIALEENPDTIMDAILALDDLYKEGQLPEDAYLERRAELKARLQKIMDA